MQREGKGRRKGVKSITRQNKGQRTKTRHNQKKHTSTSVQKPTFNANDHNFINEQIHFLPLPFPFVPLCALPEPDPEPESALPD
jgi:hypothetical protein